jgi:hypothetical protein
VSLTASNGTFNSFHDFSQQHKNFQSEATSFEGSLKEIDETQKTRAKHLIGLHKQHILKEDPLFQLVLEEFL